jgi:hypothetical protein
VCPFLYVPGKRGLYLGLNVRQRGLCSMETQGNASKLLIHSQTWRLCVGGCFGPEGQVKRVAGEGRPTGDVAETPKEFPTSFPASRLDRQYYSLVCPSQALLTPAHLVTDCASMYVQLDASAPGLWRQCGRSAWTRAEQNGAAAKLNVAYKQLLLLPCPLKPSVQSHVHRALMLSYHQNRTHYSQYYHQQLCLGMRVLLLPPCLGHDQSSRPCPKQNVTQSPQKDGVLTC